MIFVNKMNNKNFTNLKTKKWNQWRVTPFLRIPGVSVTRHPAAELLQLHRSVFFWRSIPSKCRHQINYSQLQLHLYKPKRGKRFPNFYIPFDGRCRGSNCQSALKTLIITTAKPSNLLLLALTASKVIFSRPMEYFTRPNIFTLKKYNFFHVKTHLLRGSLRENSPSSLQGGTEK